jgi:hypothetical protein
MGKADHIRRLRKLKEEKRKRLADTAKKSALQLAENKLKQRIETSGNKVVLNSGPVKYSQLIGDFVRPTIEPDDDFSMIRLKFLFGIQAWNAASIREKSEKKYNDVRDKLKNLMPDNEDWETLFNVLVNRKIENFNDHKVIILDLEFGEFKNNNIDFSVVAVPISEI